MPSNQDNGHERIIEIVATFPEEYGRLLPANDRSPDEADGQNSTEQIQRVTEIASKSCLSMEQMVQISHDSADHSRCFVEIVLYLDDPGQSTQEQDAEVQLIPIQRLQFEVQISTSHMYNENSSYILITNSKAPRNRVNAIRSFIEDDMGLALDQWNVDLYGGLKQLSAAGEDEGEGL